MPIDRSKFDTNSVKSEKFNTLIKKPKKKVEIRGENEFSNDAFGPSGLESYSNERELPGSKIKNQPKRKQGRPKVIMDDRYKVSLPKKISPALENKLHALIDYMPEFQEISGRVSFDKIVDTLAESYIKNRLGVSKAEFLKEEIDKGFKNLK